MKSSLAAIRRYLLRAIGQEAVVVKLAELNLHMESLAGSVDRLRREIRAAPRNLPLHGEAGARLPLKPPQSAPPRPAATGPVVERIGFLVQNEELLNHYSCVWELLPVGAVDIVIHGEIEENVPRRLTSCPHPLVRASELLASGTRYRYLVSNHPVALSPPLLPRLAVCNIRFMYAAGKSGWNLSGWNSLYDVILCFGPYHAQELAECCDALLVQMGYPRFDRYFTATADRDALCASYACDPSRKTIVWLPTWKTLSSVGLFDAEISALTERYNVVVKLHPLMSAHETERVAALSQHRFTQLITDTSDNMPLYQLADWMLFDYGGPALAGVYADKPMLLLDVPGAEDDELTGPDSPDMLIRESLPTVSADQRAIAPLLADATVWDRQGATRRALRARFFAPYLGFSSQVAAQTLLHLDRILPR